MSRQLVCVVLVLQVLMGGGAVIFNVGLPRTGTTSFHYAGKMRRNWNRCTALSLDLAVPR